MPNSFLQEFLTAAAAGFMFLAVARCLLWSERIEAQQRLQVQRHGLFRKVLIDSALLLPASLAVAISTYLQGFSPVWYGFATLLAILAILPPAIIASQPSIDGVELSSASLKAAVVRRRRFAPLYAALLFMWLWAWYTRA